MKLLVKLPDLLADIADFSRKMTKDYNATIGIQYYSYKDSTYILCDFKDDNDALIFMISNPDDVISNWQNKALKDV